MRRACRRREPRARARQRRRETRGVAAAGGGFGDRFGDAAPRREPVPCPRRSLGDAPLVAARQRRQARDRDVRDVPADTRERGEELAQRVRDGVRGDAQRAERVSAGRKSRRLGGERADPAFQSLGVARGARVARRRTEPREHARGLARDLRERVAERARVVRDARERGGCRRGRETQQQRRLRLGASVLGAQRRQRVTELGDHPRGASHVFLEKGVARRVPERAGHGLADARAQGVGVDGVDAGRGVCRKRVFVRGEAPLGIDEELVHDRLVFVSLRGRSNARGALGGDLGSRIARGAARGVGGEARRARSLARLHAPRRARRPGRFGGGLATGNRRRIGGVGGVGGFVARDARARGAPRAVEALDAFLPSQTADLPAEDARVVGERHENRARVGSLREIFRSRVRAARAPRGGFHLDGGARQLALQRGGIARLPPLKRAGVRAPLFREATQQHTRRMSNRNRFQ